MLGEEREEGALGSEPGPSSRPGRPRASLSPLPEPRAKLPQASSDGPLLVAGLTDLCSQGGSICHEMWDPVPHHPRE